jgi:hypothetical protein
MPGPLSETEISTLRPLAMACTSICLSSPVYLYALVMRLSSACSSAARSTSTMSAESTFVRKVGSGPPLERRMASKAASAPETMSETGVGARSKARLPASSLASSSTRSTRPSSRLTSRASSCSTCCWSAGSPTRPIASVSTNMRIEVSGVRSSCETVDTKSFCRRASESPRRRNTCTKAAPVMARMPNTSTRMPSTTSVARRANTSTRMAAMVASADGTSAARMSRSCARRSSMLAGARNRMRVSAR